MKTGVITLHQSYSYGACLQAYATYKTISNMGFDVEFINYVNKYEQNQNHLISRTKEFGIVKNIIRTTENIFLRRYVNRVKAFNDFHRNLPKTKLFTDSESLNDLHYDILLSGSDQLWNPDIFGGLDDVYFLNFGKAEKRIAYAASAGSHVFSDYEKERVTELLKRYTAISTRENDLKKQVEEMIGKTVSQVLDPTFLVSANEWLQLTNGSNPGLDERYILVYMIGVPYLFYFKYYAKIIRFYADKLGVKVYAVSPDSYIPFYGCDKNLTALTPFELVQAINNAELVITSSFHGVAFSASLNKRFIALKNPNNPLRVKNLLQLCGLEDRIIGSLVTEKCERLLDDVDYKNTNESLAKMREFSCNWLREKMEK